MRYGTDTFITAQSNIAHLWGDPIFNGLDLVAQTGDRLAWLAAMDPENPP